MANKVKVATKLDLDHELGPDHFSTWRSQLEIGFLLHNVEKSKNKYLAAASNLGESASHYLWQRYATIPTGDQPIRIRAHCSKSISGVNEVKPLDWQPFSP